MFCLQHPAPTPGSRGCTDFRQKGQNCKAHYEMATGWACHHRDRDESPHGISPKPCQLPLLYVKLKPSPLEGGSQQGYTC